MTSTKPVIYIHCNDYHLLPARVGAYSLISRSQHADQFEVRLVRLEETKHLQHYFNKRFFWWGHEAVHTYRDTMAFAPLRRLVPELMNFSGRALVLDPDIFAMADVFELLNRDMKGKALLCRRRIAYTSTGMREVNASSVMLFDCDKLTDWNWHKDIDDIFNKRIDFGTWITLSDVPEEKIGLLEEHWNHLDYLDENTKLLHMSELITQPWKTGLVARHGGYGQPAATSKEALRRIKLKLRGREARHTPHPDKKQEAIFFSLLKESIEHGNISESFVRAEIRKRHLRADAFAIMDSLSEPLPSAPAGRVAAMAAASQTD